MTKEELVARAQIFSVPAEELEEVRQANQRFLERFPLDRLTTLTPEEYCAVGSKESFLYMIEHAIPGFGVGGGSAAKFGIYQGKDKRYYTGAKGNKRELIEPELSNELRGLTAGIVKTVELSMADRASEIRALNIPIWPMVLLKILNVYAPEKFLKIAQEKALRDCGRDLGVSDEVVLGPDLIYLNSECKRLLGNLQPMSTWDDETLGKFIWQEYYPWTENGNPSSPRNYWVFRATQISTTYNETCAMTVI